MPTSNDDSDSELFCHIHYRDIMWSHEFTTQKGAQTDFDVACGESGLMSTPRLSLYSDLRTMAFRKRELTWWLQTSQNRHWQKCQWSVVGEQAMSPPTLSKDSLLLVLIHWATQRNDGSCKMQCTRPCTKTISKRQASLCRSSWSLRLKWESQLPYISKVMCNLAQSQKGSW